MSTIPVRYGSNPEKLYLACDEFGEFAAILADSFEEAHEEALCLMYERDGACDHGVSTPGEPADEIEAQESCDCSMSDDGPVWAIYLTLIPKEMTMEQFEESYGEDLERIERGELVS